MKISRNISINNVAGYIVLFQEIRNNKWICNYVLAFYAASLISILCLVYVSYKYYLDLFGKFQLFYLYTRLYPLSQPGPEPLTFQTEVSVTTPISTLTTRTWTTDLPLWGVIALYVTTPISTLTTRTWTTDLPHWGVCRHSYIHSDNQDLNHWPPTLGCHSFICHHSYIHSDDQDPKHRPSTLRCIA